MPEQDEQKCPLCTKGMMELLGTIEDIEVWRCAHCRHPYAIEKMRRTDMEKKKKIVTEDMEDADKKLKKLKDKVVND